MTQKYSQKAVNTFVKGLVTEASEMTFPEDASSDELNCDLLKNGARRRRQALVYEENDQESSFTVPSGAFHHTATWYNVAGKGGLEFLVVQINNMVYFYDKSVQPISAQEKSFSIDLYAYNVSNDFLPDSEPIQASSISGFLVITSPAIDPIKIKYDTATDSITVSAITIKVRDFDYLGMSSQLSKVARASNVVTVTTTERHGIIVGNSVTVVSSDSTFNGTFTVTAISGFTFTYSQTGANVSTKDVTGLATANIETNTYPTTQPSQNYIYDLYNQGWYSDRNGQTGNAYVYWDSQRSDWPPRSAPWWIAKNTSSNQDTTLFSKIDAGNTLAPNGHYILNFFSRDRSTASGLTGLPILTETARFRATATYAGRVWYAGLDSSLNGGKIFFSKVVGTDDDLGLCYQQADPTAEDTAGVVDSDGGYLVIPDAANIRALFPMGSMLLVFASNGIWSVGGVDDIFKASEFYVKKLSPFGLYSSKTLVNAMGTPIFWDTSGIYTVSDQGSAGGGIAVEDISGSIKTFYDNIVNEKKLLASSVFDRLNKRVYWMYSDNSEAVTYKNNYLLVLDLDLKAFFPWAIKDKASSTPYLMNGFFLSGVGSNQKDYPIAAGEDLVITGSNNVSQILSSNVNNTADVKFLVRKENGKMTMAEFHGTSLKDWGTENYSSYAETGYNFMGDATLKKNAPYITTYMRRTEENFISDGNGGYVADFPSSCLLTVKWDLSGQESRWSDPSQIYRMVNYPVVNPSDLTFNYPYDTIVARTKVRGKGRVLRLRFESVANNDFYLVGWESIIASNPRF